MRFSPGPGGSRDRRGGRQPRRLQRVLATVLAMLMLATACAPTGTAAAPSGSVVPKTGGTLRIGTSTDVLTLDMANYKSGQDWLIGSLILEPLVSWGSDGAPHAALAESWSKIDDLTYQFKLRKGVKFTDGTDLTAAAVKQQFERAAQGLYGKSYYFMIASIVADNDTTVTFKLKSPYSPFINNVSIQTGALLSPAAVTKYGDNVGRNPVGTGPYKLTSWVQGGEMVLERNPDYWGTKPKLDKIIVKFFADESTRMAALEAGEIDVAQNAPPQRAAELRSSAKLQLIGGTDARSLYLGFTHSNPILSKKDVRQAIMSVVDRNALVQNVTEGITRVSSGFVPPEVVKLDSTPLKPDLAGAKALLAKAGYPNGFSIEIWVPIARYLRGQEITQALQQPLKSIGVDATIKALDYAAFAAGVGRHEAGLYVAAWGFTSNPDSTLRAAFYTNSPGNWSDYKNPAYDKLLDDAVAQSSYDSTVKLWTQANQLLIDDVAVVPVYWNAAIYAASKKVHNFVQTPLSLWNLSETWIE
ncbi:MAG: peptide/nickel transport system substrate-binding protein [Chloroflexota bacterium]|nr:peptide/nickel transport system substrate-binding protein [Chloroflexota bacterium]